ncbi:hypothetical protein MIMGU_mgv1a022015mg [Erythranthe guttata]|uniref:NB-ARC domain-containing protein n=1 Tax=Erythranthe guttata TaxID=4155 RepID=A0A022Q8L0_ERYGU|nr:hypothetical protein MIMGU_mgv1a022015mg [Erythranthe guttata]
MAYAAVISLKTVIERLLKSSEISFVPPSKKIIKSAYKQLLSLQEVLKRFDNRSRISSERVNALDGEIREVVRKLEDVIESRVSTQILSQSEEIHPLLVLSLDMVEVKTEIDSLNEKLKKMEGEYATEIEDNDAVSSRIYFGGNKSKMVGLSDQFQEIQTRLLDTMETCQLMAVYLVGMAGIGKTTLAVELFEDPLTTSHFDARVFVTIGRKYHLKAILEDILSQMNPETDKILLKERDVKELKRMMYQNLKAKTYLIVLDDVWNMQVWDDLGRLFHANKNRCRILLTTRVENICSGSDIYSVRLLNEEESWDLLREKVFGEESPCPPQLEKAGKKIAENCEGLPLLIVTVADILFKVDKTTEYWKKAAEKDSSVFMDANDQIMSKVILLSYEYLPQNLKSLFLYMEVFPQNYESPGTKLENLLNAEGFFEPTFYITPEEPVSKNFVMMHKKSFMTWHMYNIEAEKNKFFHVVDSYNTTLAQGKENHRRLCIRNNILFAIKDVQKSMASFSNARSLLCFGPYHKYPLPICLEYLRLLRVFDAVTIRLYEFPMDVLKLVQLRYLALTYDGNLPPSISKLRNLQDLSYLPIEIWEMQELNHLQITGSNLPDPCGATLPNLSRLFDISPRCCTKKLLERIPRLEMVRVQFDYARDIAESSKWFDLMLNLRGSLYCVISNPISMSKTMVPPSLPNSLDTGGIGCLSLSGFGYPWEYMRLIATLSCLTVLELRCYAFRGAKWETQEKAFRSLKVLVIEDSDLVQWTVGIKAFRCLEHLTMKRCHKLEEIPRRYFGASNRLKIEMVDCNPLGVACAKEMEQWDKDRGSDFRSVSVRSSWDD